MTLVWWALFVAGVAGVVLAAGAASVRYGRGAAVVATALFLVSVVLTLVSANVPS